jgi:hypothetical protein
VQSIDLVSPLSWAECVYRLRTRVDEGFFGPRSIVGHFGQTSVRLRKRIGYRSWFQPQVKVDLVEDGTQTLLRCRPGVHPLSAWFMGLLFAGMTVAAAMIPESDGFGASELLILLASRFSAWESSYRSKERVIW